MASLLGPDPSEIQRDASAALAALVHFQHGGTASLSTDQIAEASRRLRLNLSHSGPGDIITIRTADHTHHYVPKRVSNETWAGEPIYILRCQSCDAAPTEESS